MANDSFVCPNCGADVPARARVCPECGADEKTGWSDDTIYDGTGIEDPADFSYADWKHREVAGHPTRRQVVVGAVVLVMLALLVLLLVR